MASKVAGSYLGMRRSFRTHGYRMGDSQGVALGWYAPPPWGGRRAGLSGYAPWASGENVRNLFPAGSGILKLAEKPRMNTNLHE